MKKLFFVFLLSMNFLLANTLFILPQDKTKAMKTLIKEIKNANSTIDIAIYHLTSRKIAKALRQKASDGVKIFILGDKSESDGKYSIIRELKKYKNITVKIIRGKQSKKYSKKRKRYFGIMHIKMIDIDKKIIFLGSANYTKSAFSINYETLMKVSDKDILNKVNYFFDEMK